MANIEHSGDAAPSKTCTKCRQEFPATLEFFGPHRGGLFSWCRPCHVEAARKRRQSPIAKARELAQRSQPEVRERRRNYLKQYNIDNREMRREKRNTPEAVEKRKAYMRVYFRDPENRERAKARKKERRFEIRKYMRERYRAEPWVRLRHIFATAIHQALTNPRKAKLKWWEVHCGYSVAELRAHLERGFTSEMSWENYGAVWEIDHIVPMSKFKVETVLSDDFKKAWGLANLQPLLKHLNREKQARTDWVATPSASNSEE